jgi:hypothetical protein
MPGLANAQSTTIGASGVTTGLVTPAGNLVTSKADLQTALGGKADLSFTPTNATAAFSLQTQLSYSLTPSNFGTAGAGGDDTAVLQAGINACAGKATFLIPAGMTCNHHGLLTIPANSHIRIEGTLFLIAGSNANSLVIQGNNVTIDGRGVIDGNSAHNAAPVGGGGPYVGGIVTDTSLVTYPTLYFHNITIRDLTIQNVVNWPISIYSCDGVLVEGTFLTNAGNAPQFANGTINGIFCNNRVHAINDYGFAFYEGCSQGICSDNIFNSVACIGVLTDGNGTSWSSIAQSGIIIESNYIRSASNNGIIIANVTGVSGSNITDATVRNNTIINSGTLNVASAGGIQLAQVANITVEDNLIDGGGHTGGTWYGIVGTNAPNCSIKGNRICNGGNGGSSITSYGIAFNGANAVIENNHIYDTQTTPTMQNGFTNPYSSGGIYKDNTFGSTITGPAYLGNVPGQAPGADTTISFAGVTAKAANSGYFISAGLSVNGTFSVTALLSEFLGVRNSLAIQTGAATGNPVIIQAYGADANIDIVLQPQGTGSVKVNGPLQIVGIDTTNGYVILTNVVGTGAFANNAAATAAGVPLYGVYMNTSGGLNIRNT